MRNPKTMLLLSVIVCVLLLGVAYAAIQNVTLTVTGNVIASPDQGNFKVKFTGTPTYEGTGTAEVEIIDDLSAVMNVSGMKKAGDTMTVKFYGIVDKSSGLDASLEESITHANSEYFKVSAFVTRDSYDTLEGWVYAPEFYLTVKVELIKTPISGDVTDKINVNVIASPVSIS